MERKGKRKVIYGGKLILNSTVLYRGKWISRLRPVYRSICRAETELIKGNPSLRMIVAMSWEIDSRDKSVGEWSIFEWKWNKRRKEFRRESVCLESNGCATREDCETSLFPTWRTESKRDQNCLWWNELETVERKGKKRDAS